MDNRGIALKRKRGGERVTVGEVEEAMGQSGFVPDLQDDLGNLGRGEPIREEIPEIGPTGF